MKYVVVILLTILCGCDRLGTGPDPALRLTTEELEYLKTKKVITYAGEVDHAPWIYADADAKGDLQGISQDYLNLVASKLKVRFEATKVPLYVDGLDMVRKRQLDIIPTTRKTAERELYLAFSSVYTRVQGVEVVRASFDPEKIPNVVGIAKGFAVKGWIEKERPTATLIEFSSDTVSFKNMSSGTVESAFMDTATFYWLQPQADIALKARPIAFDYPYHFAALKENQILINIISKTLALVTQEENDAVDKKWLKGLPTANLIK